MDFGIFNAPYALGYRRGERTAAEVIEWDLQMTQWADEFGLSAAYFAEHFTIGNEPSPAPDLMIAAAAQRTTTIRLGAAAHLLPYTNPINLAHRLMWLDHLTGGRYIAGFAPGSFQTDAQLYGTGDANLAMTREALEVIEAIWTREPPFTLEGRYWPVDMPAYSESFAGPHLKPLQRPYPEVIMTGMQAESPTFVQAGQRGYSPMSQQVGVHVLTAQWQTYAAAATAAGRTPDRGRWRVLRDIFVADTDAEARRLVVDGMAGETWREIILPTFKVVRSRGGSVPYALGSLLLDEGMDIEELTVEWLVDNFWLVGSPETVTHKARELNDQLGGCAEITGWTYDYSQTPEVYRRHLELLGREVAPALADVGERVSAAV